MRRVLLVVACCIGIVVGASFRAHGVPLIEVETEPVGRGPLAELDEPIPIVVSPDGRHVYVGNHFRPGALGVFERDVDTGQLRFVEVHLGDEGDTGPFLGTVITMAMSPDGLYLYVPAHYAASMSVFARDPASGRLTFVQLLWPLEALSGAWSAVVSPDGAYVYVSAYYNDMIGVFSRSAATGELAYVGAARNGEGGVVALEEPAGMVLSPGGEHLYVAASGGNAVVAFERDAATGLLTFLGASRDGDPGVGTLTAPYVLAISPDGAHVYASISADGTWGGAAAIVIFGRDPASGILALQGAYTDGFVGRPHHDRTMLVSPDGERVVVVNTPQFGPPSSLLVLARDVTTGALVHDGDLTGPPVERPQNMAMAPAGDTLYASCGRIGILALRAPTVSCPPTPLSGCRVPGPRGARLVLRDDAFDGKDLLKWKWRGGSTGAAAFGDPVAGTTDYAFCLYADDTARAGTLARGGAVCGNRSCWKASGASGASYRDRTGRPSGVGVVKLRVADSGDAKLSVTGKGDRLPEIALPFGPATVRAQLMNAAGECWESVFSPPHDETNPAVFDQWTQ